MSLKEIQIIETARAMWNIMNNSMSTSSRVETSHNLKKYDFF